MQSLSSLRASVAASLRSSGQHRAAFALEQCETARMMVLQNGAPAAGALAVAVGCRVRVCPRCQARTGRRIGLRWSNRLKRLAARVRLALITLTVRTRDDWTLREAHAALYSVLRHLRMQPKERKWWRKHVTGALWARHQTRNAIGWHAHLHLVVQVPADSQVKRTARRIADLWRRECESRLARPDGLPVTVEDAQDVKILRGKAKAYDAIRYATSYSASELTEPEHAAEVLRQMRGVRQNGTWLQWHASSRGEVAEELRIIRQEEPKFTCLRLSHLDLQVLPQGEFGHPAELAEVAGGWSRRFTWRDRYARPDAVPLFVEDLERLLGCALTQQDLAHVLPIVLQAPDQQTEHAPEVQEAPPLGIQPLPYLSGTVSQP